MATDYPALIITYARPEGVKRLLDICLSAGLRRIYIAIDGPKNVEASHRQLEIVEVIKHFQKNCNIQIHVWHRSINLGVAVGVISAIDWFFTNEKSGFILEDDLIPSLDFFKFASDGLAKYELNKDVWMISGSRMVPSQEGQVESDWSCYPMIWGWATWAARWLTMRETYSESDRFNYINFFSAKYNFWSAGSRRAKSGLIDTWDIPLAFAQWSQSKFSMIPPVNLVTNIGFDSQAMHTSGDVFPLNHPAESLPLNYSLSGRPNLISSNRYDKELEEILFRIRPRHRLLRFYSVLINVIRFRGKKLGNLNMRLSQVIFPD